MHFDDVNVTRNYIDTCYAQDTNLTLTLNGTTIIYPGSTAPLTNFLYYNPVEDDGVSPNGGEGNVSLLPVTSGMSLTSLTIENNASSFPANAPDGNGTTSIAYKLNFDRKIHLVVNPIRMALTDVNITDTYVNSTGTYLVQGGDLVNQTATLYYARSRASQFFYEDISEPSVLTPILVDVYCDLGYTACDSLGINTVNGQTNEMDWWLSWNHDALNGDGNITLRTGATEVTPVGAGAPTVTPTNVQIMANAQQANVTVTSNATTLPMTAEIELVRESVLAPTIYTNEWLIYNPNTDAILQASPSPFYKVRFIGTSGWAGHGDTGHVVDSNTSIKKNRRLGW